MCENFCHDKIIAKIQHFSEMLDRVLQEKESLSMTMNETSLKENLLREILVYQQISREYDKIFKNIIFKDSE